MKKNGSEMSLQMKEECVVSSGDMIKLQEQKYHFVIKDDNSEEMDKSQSLKGAAKSSSEEKVTPTHF